MSASTTPLYRLHVAGNSVDASDGRTFESLDPFSGQSWALVADAGRADVDEAVNAARAALSGTWGATTPPERARFLLGLAALVERDADKLAESETRDNGKLLRESKAQMTAIPDWLRYFAAVAETARGEVIPTAKPNFHVYTRSEPVGVVAAIVPWNSPLFLLIFKLAPALAAGCTLVVKPSPYTPVTTVEFAELCSEAGLPAGVVNVLPSSDADVGEALVAHEGVDLVAFTGSTSVGRRVAGAAAARLARTTLELGGKSAQIVFPDANLQAARDGILAGIFAASGQTCVAGSRLLVHEEISVALLDLLVARTRSIKLGDPRDPASEMGPLANEAQLELVRGRIAGAVRDGATILTGGDDGGLGGLFVAPTILTGVEQSHPICQEEVFGPVIVVDTFCDEEEAIAKANATRYGLAAGVWTQDIGRAHRVSARLRAGTVWVNAYRVLAPQVPFGGFGASGLGRENGLEALREYTETKAVWIETVGATRDPFTLG